MIDGTGAPPRQDATVLLQGRHIRAVGARSTVRVPPNANVIDGRGLFVLPGFIDAGALLSPPDRRLPWDTTYVPRRDPFDSRYDRHKMPGGLGDEGSPDTLIGRRAAAALRYGVTTIRSHGLLRSLRAVRDSIRIEQLRGPRLLITGYVVGGVDGGSEFPPDSLRLRLTQYLDHGIDFVKYSGTAIVFMGSGTPVDEYSAGPPYLVFGERTQRAIVTTAHERGVSVEAHANSPEGLRMILEAGVDLVQHPELMLSDYLLPNDLVRLFARRGVICGLLPRVSAADGGRSGWQNARALIREGCPVAVTSGTEPGRATLEAIQALVTLGMTPMAAIVSATRTGAMASRLLDEIGTVTPGKVADLVVLRADPLLDIKNIEQTEMVFAAGIRIPGAAVADQRRHP